jgi:hypothetical protein
LSGQSLDVESPMPLTLDACAATTPPGILNPSAWDRRRRSPSITPAMLDHRATTPRPDALGDEAVRARDTSSRMTAEPWIGGG